MQTLKSLYKKTKEKFDSLEKELVDCYIDFLRKVAKFYLQKGRRVFFEENSFVHWGEGNFGWLVIEGGEQTDKVFGDYISEIKFEPKISKEIIKDYIEIKENNLEDIRYEIRG
jgi:hypothetical protein